MAKINELRVGDRVIHIEYGMGKVTNQKEDGIVSVAFENEHEVVIRDVLDTENHFEDNTRVEVTRFIDVHFSGLEKKIIEFDKLIISKPELYLNNTKDKHCYKCQKPLSADTHKKCDKCPGLVCDCDACFCNANEYYLN